MDMLENALRIFSVPANSSDALYCLLLAQNAVHGAMAGFSGISVGLCNNRLVYLPARTLSKNRQVIYNILLLLAWIERSFFFVSTVLVSWIRWGVHGRESLR